MKPYKGILENWYFEGLRCVGDLTNGTTVITSVVLNKIYDGYNCVEIITENSRYILGKPLHE